MMEEHHIKAVIKDTILEFEGRNKLQFQKPTTFQGWMYVVLAVGSAVALIWGAVVNLHKISEHHKIPHHAGAVELIERIEKSVAHHAASDVHLRDAELELKILKQTAPMKVDIQRIQQDVGAIRTRVDMILERQQRDH